MKTNPIHEAARHLAGCKKAVVLTGAGISVESGIPPFRGPGGLWEKIDPMEYAHIDAFHRNPADVWKVMFAPLFSLLIHAEPNAAHLSLARLERLVQLRSVITQNVDRLHQRAGSRDVIEFHGNFEEQRCSRCQNKSPSQDLDLQNLPPRCDCGGILRPDCVLFGELIPSEPLLRSRQLAESCDVMLVVGTSAVVQPAASIPVMAKEHGGIVIEVNLEATHLSRHISDVVIEGPAGQTLTDLVTAVEKQLT